MTQATPNPPPPTSLPELPSQPTAATPDQTVVEPRGRSGCAWSIIGALGCLILLLLPILVLTLAGVVTINSLTSGLERIFNPPIRITAQVVLDRVQNLSQLTTVRYNYSAEVMSERDMPDILKALYGERQVFVAVGHVNAGIDLSQLTPADISQNGDTLIIRLPPPALQDCFLNEQLSYVKSLDTGIFAQRLTNIEDDARQFAVHQYRDQALETGILDEVQGQAQMVIADLAHTISPDLRVQVVTTPPDPNAPLPESCR